MNAELRYKQCATCGHLGASHSRSGRCLAVVHGVGDKPRVRDCTCRAFVPPVGADRAEP